MDMTRYSWFRRLVPPKKDLKFHRNHASEFPTISRTTSNACSVFSSKIATSALFRETARKKAPNFGLVTRSSWVETITYVFTIEPDIKYLRMNDITLWNYSFVAWLLHKNTDSWAYFDQLVSKVSRTENLMFLFKFLNKLLTFKCISTPRTVL